jgi:hypothetical protein
VGSSCIQVFISAMQVFHRVAGIVLAMVAGLPTAGASEKHRREPLRIGIALDVAASEIVQDATAVIAEADAVWRQHGFMVVDVSRDNTQVDVFLKVLVMSRSGRVDPWRTAYIAHAGHGGLGAIVFDDSGRPSDAIVLNADAIADTIKRAPGGLCDFKPCPPALLKVVMARALGRVLAHEIGHFVLALPSHAPSGLMRPTFSGRELTRVDRKAFALSAELLPRLRDRLVRLRSTSGRK